MIYQNTDSPKLDKALDRYTKICKKIGRYDYQIESGLAELYWNSANKQLEDQVYELKSYRAVLESQKAQAEARLFKAFGEQYS
ncbi:hypothetical protein [Companilactobacillus nodensis]|uniref:Uncharacterized protein n=1 Tax=Companilactobacillus nodensis DSM 19682 = JCM 14932 = NBRC 107160 TaxID=1423775 RepID=A0A0R1K5I0_9LACO|nr:hypothetical protein [Companilactobacillus nodensis]KRK78507.1 hypothetical protein FD03_GL002281 [Companilactobacillus nodensis DSM 19682 = JCM 14932 = NBRC 107160]